MGFGRAKGDGVDRVMVFYVDLLKVLKINQPGAGWTNPSEKYESNWKSSPSAGENETYSPKWFLQLMVMNPIKIESVKNHQLKKNS